MHDYLNFFLQWSEETSGKKKPPQNLITLATMARVMWAGFLCKIGFFPFCKGEKRRCTAWLERNEDFPLKREESSRSDHMTRPIIQLKLLKNITPKLQQLNGIRYLKLKSKPAGRKKIFNFKCYLPKIAWFWQAGFFPVKYMIIACKWVMSRWRAGPCLPVSIFFKHLKYR
jgi:hypothetical protein